MLFNASITEMDKFYIVGLSGPVSISKIIGICAYLRSDQSVREKGKVVVDLSGATLKFSIDEIDRVIALFEAKEQKDNLNSPRIAIVVRDIYSDTELAQAFIDHTLAAFSLDIDLFYTLENAVFWLVR